MWLRDVQFTPDLIVGILRGGSVPAVYLSHELDCPVRIIEWSTRDSNKRDTYSLDQVAAMAESGTKVLIIDDIVDSGTTMQEIKSRLFDTKNNILYVALWYNPSQITTIHYWCNAIDRSIDDRWVYMPWEKLPQDL
jgi:hypoxanthine phosphoribosyltransferase